MALIGGLPSLNSSLSLNRRRRKQAAVQDPSQDPSFLQQVGQTSLNGLGAVANALDLPGSMVRDTLTGHNPFDQLLSPFHDSNRTTGRDMLRQFGLAGPEDTWGNFAGGLATEVATDPLTLLGLKPLGATAKGVEQATQGIKGATSLGAGIRAGERALATGKVPFGPRWAIGTGERAAQIGDKLDKAYDAARYSRPGLDLAAMFSARAGGNRTRIGQQAAAQAFDLEQEIRRFAKKKELEAAGNLHESGATDPTLLRSALERGPQFYPNLSTGLQDDMHKTLADVRNVSQSVGRGSQKMTGEKYVNYFSRYRKAGDKTNFVTQAKRPASKLSAIGAKDAARQPVFKNWKRGTEAINEFVQDPKIKQIVESAYGKTAAERNTIKDQLTRHIQQNWGREFDPLEKAVIQKGKRVMKQVDRSSLLAKYLMRADFDTLEKGLFSNHPLVDYHGKILHDLTKSANVHAVNSAVFNYLPDSLKSVASIPKTDTLRDLLQLTPQPLDDAALKAIKVGPSTMKIPKDATTFRSLYAQIGMHPKRAAASILHQHGLQTTAENLAHVMDTLIPNDVARDLLRGFEKHAGPEVEGVVKKLLNSYTNLFKAGALAHPARFFRDMTGNVVQTMLHGVATPGNFLEAHHVYLGKKLKDLPNVAMEYAEHGPGDVFKHTDISGSHVVADHPELSHILGTIPGIQKSTVGGNAKDVIDTLFRGKDGATWNPLKAKVRGVNGASETTAAPFMASDKISAYTDQVGRLAAFINLRRKGWTPEAAMQRVNELLVNYDPATFTQTEKRLKQIFPFYSFASRMTKETAKELATNPGGGLANAIRVQNAANENSAAIPEHITGTASIPLGSLDDGTKRYLSSLGLMHDDALRFLNPDPIAAGQEAAGSLNPVAQKLFEALTGRSLYFKDADGPKSTDDLDPNIGRLLANLTGQKDAVRYPGDKLVEALSGTLPTSRLVTTARTLSDSRKSGPVKALNTLTGIKISDVSPQAQERTLRTAVEKAAKAAGGKTFSEVYFPSEKYPPGANEEVDRYRQVLRALAARGRRPKSTSGKRRKNTLKSLSR